MSFLKTEVCLSVCEKTNKPTNKCQKVRPGVENKNEMDDESNEGSSKHSSLLKLLKVFLFYFTKKNLK